MQRPTLLSSLPSKYSPLSRSKHPRKIFQSWRHGPSPNTRRDWITQAQFAVGRLLRRFQSYRTRVLSASLSRWSRSPKFLEYRAPTTILPLTHSLDTYCLFNKWIDLETMAIFAKFSGTFKSSPALLQYSAQPFPVSQGQRRELH